MDTVSRAVEQLAELGFSQYEARAYVGLLGAEPLTGYALANRTRIPQPKVYETLRRLEDKQAVVRVGDDGEVPCLVASVHDALGAGVLQQAAVAQ